MTRAGALAGGLVLAVVAAVSMNASLQRDPLAIALPALALFALTLADAGAGVLVTLALVPLVPVLGTLVRGPAVAPAELALLCCLAGVLFVRRDEARRASLLRSALLVSALAAAAGGLAATLAALPGWALPGALASLARNLYQVRPDDAAAPLRAGALHALALAAYFLVRRIPPRRRALALPLLVGSLSAAAVWALVEAAGGPHLWPHEAYDRFARFARSAATVGDHNAAATLFVLFLFPAAAYAASRRGAARLAGGVAFALLLAGLLVTGSRTAWLFAALAALAVATRGFLAGRGRRAALVTACVIALLAGAAALLPGTTGSVLRERLESLAPGSAATSVRYGRLPFWRTGLAMAAAHPLSGVGPGRVPAVFSSYRPSGLPVARENLHSWPLQCVAENGLPGGALLLLPFAALVPLLWRGARVLRGPAAGLVPGLAAASAAGLVSHPWLLAEVQVVFWGAAALLEDAVFDAAPEPAPPRALVPAAAAVLVAWGVPLLALAPGRDFGRWGYGGWDLAEGQGQYRWVGPEAALWAAPPTRGALRIAVRRPDENPATEGMTLAVRADFGAWRRFAPDGTEWTEVTLSPGSAGGEETLVEIRASRAICPAAAGEGDRRILSVQVRKAEGGPS